MPTPIGQRAQQSSARGSPRAARLSHAGRMGASRGHLDRLAPQPPGLAGKVFTHSLGLRRDRAPARPGRAGAHLRPERRQCLERHSDPRAIRGGHGPDVEFHRRPTDRVWTRDSGPIFVRREAAAGRELGICDFKFNAWAKYDDWKADDRVPAYVARKLKLRSWQADAARRRATARRAACSKAAASTPTASGAVPDEPRSACCSEVHASAILASRAEASKRCCARTLASSAFSGSGVASQAMTPTDTSTIWPASSGLEPSWLTASEERHGRPKASAPLRREPRAARGSVRGLHGLPFEVVALPMP